MLEEKDAMLKTGRRREIQTLDVSASSRKPLGRKFEYPQVLTQVEPPEHGVQERIALKWRQCKRARQRRASHQRGGDAEILKGGTEVAAPILALQPRLDRP